MKYLKFGFLLLTLSCSHTSFRTPASLSENSFISLFREIEDTVHIGTNSPIECHQKLNSYYAKLYNISSTDLEIQKLAPNQMKDFVETSFQLRLEIKDKMKVLRVNDEDTLQCLKSVKRVVHALRYFEDYMIESLYANQEAGEKVTLKTDGAFFLRNPNYDFKDFNNLESGDVILSRGNAYSSAAIARIGDDDTQFSHLTLVYKDKLDKLFTTEAHIEIGNVVAPIETHIEQSNARTVVLRNNDSELAHKAGEYMYNFVSNYSKKNKENIKYDFAMDYHSDDKIFCSEVIYHGYLNASRSLYAQDYDVPVFKTKFPKGLIPFLNDIGVQVTKENIDTFETFGPGEIQFDSRFDIIAEWRNPEKLKDTRFKDAILTKIFEWMEKDGYNFKPTLSSKVGNSFAWLMRKTGWTRAVVKKLAGVELEEKFPTNMNVRQMNVFVVLDTIGEKLYQKLDSVQSKSKNPLSFKELFSVLDDYKNSDELVYNKYKNDRRENLRNRHGKSIVRSKRIKLTKPDFHLLFSK